MRAEEAEGRNIVAAEGHNTLQEAELMEVEVQAGENRAAPKLILGWGWGRWTFDLYFVEYQLYSLWMDGWDVRFQRSCVSLSTPGGFVLGTANSNNVCLGMPGSKQRRQRASYMPLAPTTIRSVDSTSL